MTTTDRTRKPHRLAVKVRQLESEGSDGSVDMIVFCPKDGSSKALGTCVRCASCRGLTVDPTTSASFLMCDFEEPPKAPKTAQTAAPGKPGTAGGTCVADIMTRDVVCVTPETSAESVLATLMQRGFSGLPVIDDDGKPIGIVSKTDLLRERQMNDADEEHEPLRVRSGAYEFELGSGFHLDRVSRSTAGEIMTPIAFTLAESATISQASALMAFEGVHRVPVVGMDGKVSGILSTIDVLRWLARQDGYVVPGPR